MQLQEASCRIAGAWADDELDRLKDAVTKYMALRQEYLQQGQVGI
jgi:hypothetical protein